jgi:hypothetical protein
MRGISKSPEISKWWVRVDEKNLSTANHPQTTSQHGAVLFGGGV